jgi:hypothetical protein
MTTSRDDVYRAAGSSSVADAPEPMTIAQMRRHVRCRIGAQQAPRRLGQLGSMPPRATSGTRIYPASQETDGRWSADRGTRTAHPGGLIDRQALALIEPHTKSGDWIELLPLPT